MKGKLSIVVIYVGAWIAKKGFFIWFIQTKFGRGVMRWCQLFAMTRLGRKVGRFVYARKQNALTFASFVHRKWIAIKLRFGYGN